MLELSRIKRRTGLIKIIILTLLPIALWVAIEPLYIRFYSFSDSLTSLGQISGLLGLAMMSLGLILSARLKFLEDYFGGMDKIYQLHHVLNGVGFLLIVFHPIVLTLKFFLISPHLAAVFLLPGKDWALNAGMAALTGLMLFLALSFFFGKIPYELRKLSHKFLGFAYILAVGHAFFIFSDISRNLPLRLYMLFLAILGISGFLYRSVLGKWLVKKYYYEVKSVKNMPGNVFEVELAPEGERMEFLPGQFIFISFMRPGFEAEPHPFSITSSTEAPNLTINIKSLGDYTSKIGEIAPGTTAVIEGPYGRFSTLGQLGKDQIWIAGGIGVAPFLSMARSINNNIFNIDFYYSVGKKEEGLYIDELLEISKKYPNFKLIHHCVDEKRCFLDAKLVSEQSVGLAGKNIFICAPPMVIKIFKEQFKKMGVSAGLIYSEEFQLL